MEATLSKPEVQRSFALGVFNGALFNFAGKLIDPPLVLTWFVSQLTSSNLLVGLVAPLGQACWFFPQIFISARIQRMERKLHGYAVAGVIRLTAWMLLATAVWFVEDSLLLLIGFFVLYSVAWTAGGLAGLSFYDVVAKTIPAHRRGSLFAWRQLLGGLLGLGAGWIVNIVLNHPAFPFPRGHAFLFFLYGLTIVPAMGAFVAIREPADEEVTSSVTINEQLRKASALFRSDLIYRRYIGAQLAVWLSDIALPFYGVYAKQILGAPEGMVGVYVAIRVGAQMLSNLAWGQLSDRRGNRLVMRLLNLDNGLTALLALLLVGMVQVMDLQGPWLPYLALPLFFLNGVSLPAKTISGSNFLMELVPDADRPLYLGLSNTLMGVVVIISGLGGLVVDLLGFVGLFAVTLGLGALGYVLATRLPEPRETPPRRQSETS